MRLPSLAAHPYVRLITAADPRPEARERFAAQFQADAYLDPEPLVRRPDMDAVYIATPHQFHAAHVLLAAAHGKHAITGEADRQHQSQSRIASSAQG